MGGGWGISALRVLFAMKDSGFRRMCRLISAFGKVREGILQKKDVKKVRTKPVCV